MTLETPIAELGWLGKHIAKRLEKIGLITACDLLFYFPFRYEDFSKVYNIAELEPGQPATIKGVVESISVRRSWQRRMFVTEATIADDTGSIRAVWFNQPYLKTVLYGFHVLFVFQTLHYH